MTLDGREYKSRPKHGSSVKMIARTTDDASNDTPRTSAIDCVSSMTEVSLWKLTLSALESSTPTTESTFKKLILSILFALTVLAQLFFGSLRPSDGASMDVRLFRSNSFVTFTSHGAN